MIQGVPAVVHIIQEAEVPVVAIAIAAGAEVSLQGPNILIGPHIDLVRGLLHHGLILSHLFALHQDLDQDPDPRYHCLLVTKGSVVVQSTVPAGAQAEAAVGASLVPVHHWQDLVEVDWVMCSVSCENNEF